MVSRFLGIIGLVTFGFGVLGGLVIGSFSNPIVFVHVVVGLFSLIVWAVKAGKESVGDATQIIKGRTTRYGSQVVIYTAIVLTILVGANWLVTRHNKKVDLTEQGVYSLAPQSKELVAKLEKSMRLVSFKGVSEEDDKIEELLRRYKDENPSKINVEIVDPKAKPQLVEKYGMKQGNLIYIEYGSPSPTGEGSAVSRINESTEEAVTNAILKLTKGASKKIYFVQGHGEGDISSGQPDGLKAVTLALQDEHLGFAPLVMASVGSMPADAAAVVLAAPRKLISPEEKKIFVEYVKAGGRLLLLTDPRTTDDVKELAATFGITVEPNVVLDKEQRLFSGPSIGAQPIVTTYDATSPITKSFTKETVTIFSIASSLSKAANPEKGVTYSEFAKSSPSAWGETDLASLLDSEEAKAQLDPQDAKGPVTLGISFEKLIAGPDKKVGRVVVFGDSDWIKNGNLNVYANRDLFLNAVNWLAGEEASVAIRAGTIRASYAPIPQATFLLILLSSFILPELILLIGLWVWWKRKAHNEL